MAIASEIDGSSSRSLTLTKHLAVGAQAIRNHQGFQADESRVLTKDILDHPDDFVMAIERYSCSVVSIVGWGRRISRKDDPIVDRALEFMHTAAQIFVPGDYWMETIPLLKYLPSWLYALPAQLRMGSDAMNRYWYALSKEGADTSKNKCFAKYVHEIEEKEGLDPNEIAGLTGNLSISQCKIHLTSQSAVVWIRLLRPC